MHYFLKTKYLLKDVGTSFISLRTVLAFRWLKGAKCSNCYYFNTSIGQHSPSAEVREKGAAKSP